MFRNILQWNFKIGDKEFNLHLDNDSPLGAVKELGNQIIAHCMNVEAQLKTQEAEKAKQEAESPKPDIEPVQEEAKTEA